MDDKIDREKDFVKKWVEEILGNYKETKLENGVKYSISPNNAGDTTQEPMTVTVTNLSNGGTEICVRIPAEIGNSLNDLMGGGKKNTASEIVATYDKNGKRIGDVVCMKTQCPQKVSSQDIIINGKKGRIGPHVYR